MICGRLSSTKLARSEQRSPPAVRWALNSPWRNDDMESGATLSHRHRVARSAHSISELARSSAVGLAVEDRTACDNRLSGHRGAVLSCGVGTTYLACFSLANENTLTQHSVPSGWRLFFCCSLFPRRTRRRQHNPTSEAG